MQYNCDELFSLKSSYKCSLLKNNHINRFLSNKMNHCTLQFLKRQKQKKNNNPKKFEKIFIKIMIY